MTVLLYQHQTNWNQHACNAQDRKAFSFNLGSSVLKSLQRTLASGLQDLCIYLTWFWRDKENNRGVTFIIFHLSEIVRLEHSCPKPMNATESKEQTTWSPSTRTDRQQGRDHKPTYRRSQEEEREASQALLKQNKRLRRWKMSRKSKLS